MRTSADSTVLVVGVWNESKRRQCSTLDDVVHGLYHCVLYAQNVTSCCTTHVNIM